LHRKDRVSPFVEALLFAADRADHVENEIKQLLDEGKIVVSDRYVYSSLAYQGAAGVSMDWIEAINKHVLHPDLAIYIYVSVENLMKRYGKEKSVMEQFETQKKVEKIYSNLVKEKKLIPVNGEQSIESAANEILTIVLNHLKD
ncbi:dTMP kinase, partial [Candidatus Bathyarchaeota archaeon]|nr:dTMP kinase [Candidatus Bathyarchaeota archaeon]